MSKALLIILVTTILFASCGHGEMTKKEVRETQLERSLISYIDTSWNQQDFSKLNLLVSQDFVRSLNGIKVASNPNELMAHMKVFFKGFPDLIIEMNEIYINEDKIFMRWECTGNNTGIYGEMPPTGKKVKINGLAHLYFNKGGELYKEDVYFNELELLQQLGYTLIPPVLE